MTKRGERTRTRLITATTKVVREVGYARATTLAIADAAGVAEGTIYRHFAHKHELFFAAIFDRNTPIVEWVAELPERAGTRTVAENLRECLERLAALRDDILPLELAPRADPELAREHQAALAARADQPPAEPLRDIAAYLAAEQRLGRVRADLDVDEAAFTILATLIGLGMAPPGWPSDPAKHVPAVSPSSLAESSRPLTERRRRVSSTFGASLHDLQRAVGMERGVTPKCRKMDAFARARIWCGRTRGVQRR